MRDAIRAGTVDLGDRARWLQEIAKSGDLGGLYADMVGAAQKCSGQFCKPER